MLVDATLLERAEEVIDLLINLITWVFVLAYRRLHLSHTYFSSFWYLIRLLRDKEELIMQDGNFLAVFILLVLPLWNIKSIRKTSVLCESI